jgi:hypothetical protein
MPIKLPFTPDQLVNKHNLTVMTKVAEIFNEHGGGGCDRSVILEDLGSWLEQRDWTDATGFYMTARIAPLDLNRRDVQDAAQKILLSFTNLFPGKTVRSEDSEPGFAKGGRMTVWVTTGVHGIAD